MFFVEPNLEFNFKKVFIKKIKMINKIETLAFCLFLFKIDNQCIKELKA